LICIYASFVDCPNKNKFQSYPRKSKQETLTEEEHQSLTYNTTGYYGYEKEIKE